MANVKKGIYDNLILIMATIATFYIALSGSDLGIKITKTSATFLINESGTMNIAGVENVYLYNGTKKLTPSSYANISSEMIGNNIIMTKKTFYANGAGIQEKYTFDKTTNNIEQFPVAHEIAVYDAKGLTLQYEVSKLIYDGVSRDATSPESFGKQMKVEWDNGTTYQKISKTTTGTKLVVKYKITSDENIYNVRLFDPQMSPDDIFNNLEQNLPSGQATFNVTIPGNININLSALSFHYNEVCGYVASTQVLVGQVITNGSNTSYQYLPAESIGKGKQSIRVIANIVDGECLEIISNWVNESYTPGYWTNDTGNGSIWISPVNISGYWVNTTKMMFGHKIAWEPTLTYGGVNYTFDKW